MENDTRPKHTSANNNLHTTSRFCVHKKYAIQAHNSPWTGRNMFHHMGAPWVSGPILRHPPKKINKKPTAIHDANTAQALSTFNGTILARTTKDKRVGMQPKRNIAKRFCRGVMMFSMSLHWLQRIFQDCK